MISYFNQLFLISYCVISGVMSICMIALQAQFDAVELITQRELVSKKISNDLTVRAKQFGITVDDIAIVRELVLYVFR